MSSITGRPMRETDESKADYCAHYVYRQLRHVLAVAETVSLPEEKRRSLEAIDDRLEEEPVCMKLREGTGCGKSEEALSAGDHREFLEFIYSLEHFRNLLPFGPTWNAALTHYERTLENELGFSPACRGYGGRAAG